jgi:hypothetical protein
MQAVATLNFFANAQPFIISSSVMVGWSNEWSIILAIEFSVIVPVMAIPFLI